MCRQQPARPLPDEVCTLGWDCLERDPSGSPVLIYTDAKTNRRLMTELNHHR